MAPAGGMMPDVGALAFEGVPVVELAGMAAPYNPRRISDHDLAALRKSMTTFGVVEPVVVNQRTGRVVGGHQRIKAAEAEGMDSLPVVYVDLADEQEKQLNLALNRITGEFDPAALADLLGDLKSSGADLGITGFSDAELDEFLGGTEGKTDPDAIPEKPEPRTKLGDVWLLGEHRLMCGDCTAAGDVAAAMAGKKAAACLTDPPYQMGKDIANDGLPDSEFITLHEQFLALCPVEKDATLICFHGTRAFPVALDAGRKAGWDFRRMLWLSKPNDVTFPWRGWILKSEAILVFSRGKGSWNDVHPYHHDEYTFNHPGGGYADDVGGHPTVKPFEVVVDLLERISRPGDIIFDPFLGSGTTALAAEKLGRKCYAMEIEPRYCDVAVTRWEEFTGETAQKES